MARHADVIGLIGNTPLVRLNRMIPEGSAEVWAKLEGANPGGSVKDRIALFMIEAAEREGALRPGSRIIEPTSGNTGMVRTSRYPFTAATMARPMPV
ncbi:MAG: pyridoxal-phosphate dependent enzyme, partial [Nitrospirales bacterium]|nr:pyridoxal-phosphate dependent enzyme [Nitrospirales bacterium]